MMNSFLKQIVSYFIQGLVLIVPLAITGYVILKILALFDGILAIDIPGAGIVVLMISLTVIGFVGSTFIAQPIKNYFNRLIDRAPLLKTIYSAIKDLLSAFVGKGKAFNKPVLVKLLGDANIEKVGFVTNEDLGELGVKGKVAVYLPHSYNFSGNMFIVPKENITPLNISAAVAMKFIVSGGVTGLDPDPNND